MSNGDCLWVLFVDVGISFSVALVLIMLTFQHELGIYADLIGEIVQATPTPEALR